MARWIVLAGFTALLVTGYFATFYAHGGPQWRSVQFVEGDLLADAKNVLKRTGATWASVKMDGQIAILSGEAPAEADRDDARQDVRAAAGPGGPWLGGITQVRDEMTVAEKKSPYIWSAVRGTGGRISLRGYVPGQRYRRAIRAEARKLFPTGVEDQMMIANGHPTGLWAETAIWSLQQLAQLQTGDARFVDAVITLRGQARDADVQAAIYASAKALPRPYQGVAEITLASASAVALPEAPEETATAPTAMPSVQRLAAADCQKLIDEAMANNTIGFANGSAALRASSHGLVDRMSQTAIDCGTLRFRITGHTDGTSREMGMPDLSQDRAETIATYMAARGVARERLLTVGAGSSQPAENGDNSTVEGQARNRRVEISVLP